VFCSSYSKQKDENWAKTHPMLQSNIGGIIPQTIQDYIGFEGENQ
jgi:hypothetical protein